MGELLKECLLVKLVEDTEWRENRQVETSSNTSNVPTFGVMIPQESGIRAGSSINDNSSKRPRQSL